MKKYKLKFYDFVVLLLTFTVVSQCASIVISAPSVRAQASGTEAGQKVIAYFNQVFESDWEHGFSYDSEVDGLGFAQSYTTYGSGYKNHSFSPSTTTGQTIITPILSPDTSLNQTINLIDAAQRSLLIEQMYFKDGLTDILNSIINAHDRGVEVKVIVDESGSDQAPITSISDAGIPVRVSVEDADAGNYFNTQHNKGIIVDGTKVLISSINWSPTSLYDNREAGLLIQNTEVATYYTDLFNYDWDSCVNYESASHFLSTESYNFPLPAKNDIEENQLNNQPQPSATYNPKFQVQTYEGEMTISCLASPDNCFDAVEDLLLNAKTSIDLSVYTLSSPYLIEALIDRIEAGVEVRLILEKENVGSYERNYNRWSMYNLTELSHNRNFASGKWASSSEDEERNPTAAFSYQHCKYAIIDNSSLILSSGNWGRSSCPKPSNYDGEGYANVDGNRDWWVVVYGDGSYVSVDAGLSRGDSDGIIIEISSGNWVFVFSLLGLLIIVNKNRKKTERLFL